MGIEQADFVKAFISAFSNDAVVNKLDSVICGSLQMEFLNLKDTHNKLQTELTSFREINVQLQKEVSELRNIVEKKDSRIADLEQKINNLEMKADEQEQYSRRNSLRMSEVEEDENENVNQKVLDILNSKLDLESPVSIDNIDRIHRVVKRYPNKNRSILIKFATYEARRNIYLNRRKLYSSSLTEDAAKNTTPAEPKIYLNEDLTKLRSTLLWQARSLKKQNLISGCWSSDGTILIKDSNNRITPIKSLRDLNRIAHQP